MQDDSRSIVKDEFNSATCNADRFTAPDSIAGCRRRLTSLVQIPSTVV